MVIGFSRTVEGDIIIKRGLAISIIGLCFVTPIFLVVGSLYDIFGNWHTLALTMLKLRGNPSETAASFQSLSYVITILISFYTLCATTFFSYLVWRVSRQI